MSKENYIMLENPLHLNYISFEITEECKQNLFITLDGSILAFNRDYLKDIDKKSLTLSMLGYQKDSSIPKKIESEDDLKKILYCMQQ